MGKRRNIYSGIDIFKFIFAIFVVLIHTIVVDANAGGIVNKVFCYALTMAVPYFFVAFGFLMQGENSECFLSSERILQSLKRILKMYFTWTIIYLPISIGYHVYRGSGFVKAAILIFRGIFFLGENYNSWPLWYLFTIIFALVYLYILVDKLKCKPIVIEIVSVLIFVGGALFVHFIPDGSILSYAFPSTRMFVGLFCIIPGIMIAYHRNSIFKLSKAARISVFSIISVILFATKIIIESNIDYNFIILPRIILTLLAASLFIVSISFLNVPNKLCGYMRLSSKVIYLTHMIFYTIYCLIIRNEDGLGLYGFLFTIVCCLIFSAIVIALKDKSNFVKNLFA